MALTLTLFGAAAIVALTAISGFFSSSELAVFSIAERAARRRRGQTGQ